jgi:hypothetical protein
LQSLRRPRPRTLIDWSAAAFVAAALFALPVIAVGVLESGSEGWFAALAVDLVVLVMHAWRTSSPLIVLAAVVTVGIAAVALWFIVTFGEACGGATSAAVVKWVGAAAIALGLGSWGVVHGLRILWATPLALVCAGGWIVLAAHLVPGGAGSCFS